MIKTSERNIHWDYYLALEGDIKGVSRYIEFDDSNFNTHSIELSRLLLAASSEVDVVMKELCRLLSPRSNANNIDGYKEVIKEFLPELVRQGVVSPLYRLSLSPWSNWEGVGNPDWGQSYNKVKHERSKHYKRANLKNVLNAVTGLYVANIHYNHKLVCSENTDYTLGLTHALSTLTPKADLFCLDGPFLDHMK